VKPLLSVRLIKMIFPLSGGLSQKTKSSGTTYWFGADWIESRFLS
jgi:hypothetical protein